MRTVYLDQMQWIRIARISREGGTTHEKALVEFLRASAETGAARYPLSGGHLIETNKNRDKSRQERLGEVMFDLSRADMFAALHTILDHELDVALSMRFPGRVDVRPLELVRRGLDHGMGREFKLALPNLRAQVAPEHFEAIAAAVRREIHRSVVTGTAPFGTAPPLPKHTLAPAAEFSQHLDTFRERFEPYDAATQERALYAMSMNDIWNELLAALQRSSISIEEFAARGVDDFVKFIDDLPSRRVDVHLHRQWLHHPELRSDSKHTDLIDWAYVGTAAMYCDVIVTERRFAHLLKQPGLDGRAVVLTRLEDLPTA